MDNANSDVTIVKTNYETLYEKLKETLQFYKLPEADTHPTISIKINLCDARPPDTGAITHPIFLDKLLRILREKYGDKIKINIVESDASVALPDLFIKWFGFTNILSKWNAKYVNLSKEDVTYIESNGDVLKKVPVPNTIINTDFLITLPKLKTNFLTKITCCLKNQFGCLPIAKKNKYHNVINAVIAEVNKVMRPDLCIVDGVISHVGLHGPAFGHPLRSNLVLLGKDPVAVDTVAAKILGFNPKSVPHILECENIGIGSMQYNLRGDFDKIPVIYKPNKVEWGLYTFALKMRQKLRKHKRGRT
ncbi:MAG: DUF362 domain-containing protein [Candidatus Odinarchaeia archaeon]